MLLRAYRRIFCVSMWYITFSKYLAKNICKSRQNEAQQFIEDLFDLVRVSIYPSLALRNICINSEPGVYASLGFIKDLYLFASENSHKEVCLSTFSRMCLGLFILHFKLSVDALNMYNRSFLNIIKDARIHKPLNVEAEFTKFQIEFMPAGAYKARDLALIKILRYIEVIEFHRLNYCVTVQISECAIMLGILLSQIENERETVLSLLHSFAPYKNKSKDFDELIWAVKDIGEYWSIKALGDALKKYVHLANLSPAPLFFSNDQHVKEVEYVITLINEQKLRDCASIFERLKQIILPSEKDGLVTIMDDHEKDYSDNFSSLASPGL